MLSLSACAQRRWRDAQRRISCVCTGSASPASSKGARITQSQWLTSVCAALPTSTAGSSCKALGPGVDSARVPDAMRVWLPETCVAELLQRTLSIPVKRAVKRN
eukprot:12409857-Karenia_brevis.AAC.1